MVQTRSKQKLESKISGRCDLRGQSATRSKFGLTVVQAENARSSKVVNMGVYDLVVTH